MSVLFSALEKSRQARAASGGSGGDGAPADDGETLPLRRARTGADGERGTPVREAGAGSASPRPSAGAPGDASAPDDAGGNTGAASNGKTARAGSFADLRAEQATARRRRPGLKMGAAALIVVFGGVAAWQVAGVRSIATGASDLADRALAPSTYTDAFGWAAGEVTSVAGRLAALVRPSGSPGERAGNDVASEPAGELGPSQNGGATADGGAEKAGEAMSKTASASDPPDGGEDSGAGGDASGTSDAPSATTATPPDEVGETTGTPEPSSSPSDAGTPSAGDAGTTGAGEAPRASDGAGELAAGSTGVGVRADTAGADAPARSPTTAGAEPDQLGPAPPRPDGKPEAVRDSTPGHGGRSGEPADAAAAAADGATQTARAPATGPATGNDALGPEAGAKASDGANGAQPAPGGAELNLQTPAGTELTSTSHREAAAAMRNDDPNRAARIYIEILDAAPRDPDALFGLGRALTAMDMPAEARQTYRDLLEVEPGHRRALRQLVELAGRGRPDKAIERLEELADGYPGFAPIHARMAEVHARAENMESAIRSMREAIRDAPDSLRFRYNLGILYDRAGRRDAAAQVYRDVLDHVRRTGKRGALPVEDVRERLRYLEG